MDDEKDVVFDCSDPGDLLDLWLFLRAGQPSYSHFAGISGSVSLAGSNKKD